MTLSMRMKSTKTQVTFDPAKKAHRKDFQTFRETGSWKHSPFQYVLDYPYESIPQMCTSRILDYCLKVKND